MEILPQDLNLNFHPLKSFKSKFTKLAPLGKGSFGQVYTALEISTGEIFAVKQISLHNPKVQYENIISEAQLLKNVSHPNIVKYYNYYEDNDNIYIIMEYLTGGTLQNFIDEHKKEKITENEARIIITQILKALNYLHYSCDICHRDIKPENILFKNENDINSLKVVDFGLSSGSFEQKDCLSKCGTLCYMAPEQISKKVYSKGVDIWSTGIILYELLNNGQNPFYKKGDTRESFIRKVSNEELKFDENCSISEMAKNLMRKLLMKNPSHRYTAIPALAHPWITMRKYDKIPFSTCDKFLVEEHKKTLSNLLLATLFLKNYEKKENKNIEVENFGEKSESETSQNSSFDLEKYEKDVIESNFKYEEKFRKNRDLLFQEKKLENETEEKKETDEKTEKKLDIKNSQTKLLFKNKKCRNSMKVIRSKSQKDYFSLINTNRFNSSVKYINPKDSQRNLNKKINACRSEKKIVIEAKDISNEKKNILRSSLLLKPSNIKKMLLKLIDESKVVLLCQVPNSSRLNLSNLEVLFNSNNENKLNQNKSPFTSNKKSNHFAFELNSTYSIKLFSNVSNLRKKIDNKIKPRDLFRKNAPILPIIKN